MAALGIDIAELYANIGATLGIARLYASWDPTTQADVDRIIRIGKRRYYNAYAWDYLIQHISILTAAPYSTGTVTIVNGVVTLAGGGAWPANAALSYLSLVSSDTSTVSGLFEVASDGEALDITLVDTSVNVATPESYEIYQYRYALPTAFSAFLDPITTENQDRNDLREAAVFPDYFLKGIQNRKTLRTGEPELFAITQLHPNTETGIPVFYLDMYPLPDAVYTLKTRIRLMPGDALLEAGAIEHPVFSECLQASILGSAEVMFTGQRVQLSLQIVVTFEQLQ